MNTIRAFAVLMAFSLTVTAPIDGQDKPKKHFLSVLKEGQVVAIKEVAGRFEITVMKNLPAGQKVIEVGDDFVVLEDPTGAIETRISVFSIKSIVTLKVTK